LALAVKRNGMEALEQVSVLSFRKRGGMYGSSYSRIK
jgi:hypothetical protein